MPEEDVGLHMLAHARSGEMVPHVGKAQPGRSPSGPAAGCKQDRLGDAPAAADVQCGACPEPFDREIYVIRIVPDAVPNGMIETDRLIPMIGGITGVLFCKLCYCIAVAVDGRRRLNILPHI